jgi:hypothetical protein
MDPVAERDQVRAAWWQEKQDEVVDWSQCRVTSHDHSLQARFAVVHHKTVGLLGGASKLRSEARRADMRSGHAEKLRDGITGMPSGGRGLQ